VRAQVVDADDRHAPREREALGRGEAHRKTGGEAGALRDRDARDLLRPDGGQSALQKRTEMREVFATGEVGHDASVGLVQRNLAVHPFAGQPDGRIEDRHGRLIAGAFEGEDHDSVEPL
jgi:hypothetical protein